MNSCHQGVRHWFHLCPALQADIAVIRKVRKKKLHTSWRIGKQHEIQDSSIILAHMDGSVLHLVHLRLESWSPVCLHSLAQSVHWLVQRLAVVLA